MKDEEHAATRMPGSARERRHTYAAEESRGEQCSGQPIGNAGVDSELVRTFVNGLAHRFNNLFQALLSRTELLGAMTLPAPHATDVTNALTADVLRGAEVVQKLMLIAREHPRRCERIDFNDIVIMGVAQSGDSEMWRADVVLMLAPKPCWVEGDRKGLEQVVANMVANARDFSPEFEQVLLRTYCDADVVCLEVADRGPGIPEGVREKICEPFFTTRRADGHDGLGLSVASAIIASHGGRLELDTSLARGTTFRVVLPASSASPRSRDESP